MAFWRAKKNIVLTGHKFHPHNPSPAPPGFAAPQISKNFTFGFAPTALAASIARTATLRTAPPAMLARWRDAALAEVQWLIKPGATFELSTYIDSLADAERTFFAGRVGAGVTDLFMNALGYTWRDNAACLSTTLAPHADFIYDGGSVSGHGVVLAEAHGSFAANVSPGGIDRQAKNKYSRQVKPYVAAMSPHGKVIHGYSIAFGSKPRTPSTFLSVTETQISKPRGGSVPPAAPTPALSPGPIPTSLILASHRSNFVLMDAPRVVTWIDWARTGGERPDDTSPVGFLNPICRTIIPRLRGLSWPIERFPLWANDLWYDPRWWPHLRERRLLRLSDTDDFVGWFVMEEKSAERFLELLSNIIRSGREPIPGGGFRVCNVETIGFTLGQEGTGTFAPEAEYTYALFRDGLALLGWPPPRREIGHRSWSPKDGITPASEDRNV